MRFVLFSFIFLLTFNGTTAQKVSHLPVGTYETYFYGYNYTLNKWLRGDIILLSSTSYQMSKEKETGQYKFDSENQRVYFLSGPLKDVFAQTALSSKQPAIILPRKENEAQKMKLAVSDVWAYLKK